MVILTDYKIYQNAEMQRIINTSQMLKNNMINVARLYFVIAQYKLSM